MQLLVFTVFIPSLTSTSASLFPLSLISSFIFPFLLFRLYSFDLHHFSTSLIIHRDCTVCEFPSESATTSSPWGLSSSQFLPYGAHNQIVPVPPLISQLRLRVCQSEIGWPKRTSDQPLHRLAGCTWVCIFMRPSPIFPLPSNQASAPPLILILSFSFIRHSSNYLIIEWKVERAEGLKGWAQRHCCDLVDAGKQRIKTRPIMREEEERGAIG